MRKLAASALAAVTFAGAIAAASPASADRRHHRHHRGNDGDVAAAAIIGGIAGLALGSALSSDNRRSRGYYSTGYYYDPRSDYYGRSYYARPHGYYGHGYRTCTRTERYYDRYTGERVKVRRQYPC